MAASIIPARTGAWRAAPRLMQILRVLDLPVVVSEFADSLKRETDFRREARSVVLFRTALADVPDLWIPDVVAERSGATVLTLEFSAGVRVDRYAKLHPEAMPKSMNTLVRLMLQSIFEEGLFHADPHPGNVFVLPDGRLSLLDFGNTGEFVLLTRAFVILESMTEELAPDHDYMQSFREEISRLTKQHFSPARIKERTTTLAREFERLGKDALGDTRRVLRRIAEGNLGRLPGLEALGSRFSRNLERLASAIAFAALVIGGSMLLMTPMGGWHDRLGEIMLVSGLGGMLMTAIRAMRRDHGPENSHDPIPGRAITRRKP